MEKGQPFVRDPGVDVVVDLLPIQYLRYQSLEFSGWASIETLVGERRVACAAVWVQPSAGKTAGVDVPYELHCRLPSYVETAAGLRSSLELRSAVYADVVVIPNIYVGYDPSTDGYYIRVIQDGEVLSLPITVGVTDGVVRVVTSDVPEGATLVRPNEDLPEG